MFKPFPKPVRQLSPSIPSPFEYQPSVSFVVPCRATSSDSSVKESGSWKETGRHNLTRYPVIFEDSGVLYHMCIKSQQGPQLLEGPQGFKGQCFPPRKKEQGRPGWKAYSSFPTPLQTKSTSSQRAWWETILTLGRGGYQHRLSMKIWVKYHG